MRDVSETRRLPTSSLQQNSHVRTLHAETKVSKTVNSSGARLLVRYYEVQPLYAERTLCELAPAQWLGPFLVRARR
jgi:hypothetical protein